jgi:hypothetical protein
MAIDTAEMVMPAGLANMRGTDGPTVLTSDDLAAAFLGRINFRELDSDGNMAGPEVVDTEVISFTPGQLCLIALGDRIHTSYMGSVAAAVERAPLGLSPVDTPGEARYSLGHHDLVTQNIIDGAFRGMPKPQQAAAIALRTA